MTNILTFFCIFYILITNYILHHKNFILLNRTLIQFTTVARKTRHFIIIKSHEVKKKKFTYTYDQLSNDII